MADLKPCPFCGVKPRWEEESHSLPQSGGDYGFFVHAYRVNKFCGVRPKVSRMGMTGYKPYRPEDARTNDQAREEVATAWNTRTDPFAQEHTV